MWFSVFDLDGTSSDSRKELAAMRKLWVQDEKVFAHIYETLTILDGKSNSLIQFNSLILTLSSLIVSYLIENHGLQSPGTTAIVLGAASSFVAAALLLTVVWIKWSSTVGDSDFGDSLLDLLCVREARTLRYRLAWVCSFAALILLLLYLMIAGASNFLKR